MQFKITLLMSKWVHTLSVLRLRKTIWDAAKVGMLLAYMLTQRKRLRCTKWNRTLVSHGPFTTPKNSILVT